MVATHTHRTSPVTACLHTQRPSHTLRASFIWSPMCTCSISHTWNVNFSHMCDVSKPHMMSQCLSCSHPASHVVPHKLVLPGSLTMHPPHSLAHTEQPTQPLSHTSSVTGSCTLISLYHFLSSWAWQGVQETISALGNLKG